MAPVTYTPPTDTTIEGMLDHLADIIANNAAEGVIDGVRIEAERIGASEEQIQLAVDFGIKQLAEKTDRQRSAA